MNRLECVRRRSWTIFSVGLSEVRKIAEAFRIVSPPPGVEVVASGMRLKTRYHCVNLLGLYLI